MIEKESTKKSFSEDEPDIDNIFPSITKPCEDVLKEKYVYGAEPGIEINASCTEKTYAGLIEKEEEEETNKEKESFYDTPTSLAEKKKILKGGLQYFELFFSII